MDEVLRVLYLLINVGYLSTGGAAAVRRDLVEDAEWLTVLLAHLLPDQPEIMGLLALIRLHRARDRARFGPEGASSSSSSRTDACGIRAAIADRLVLSPRGSA